MLEQGQVNTHDRILSEQVTEIMQPRQLGQKLGLARIHKVGDTIEGLHLPEDAQDKCFSEKCSFSQSVYMMMWALDLLPLPRTSFPAL